MRKLLCVAFMLFCGNCVLGAPPVSGGFMTCADSSVCIYWFHPRLHSFEQGFDGDVEELSLVAGDEAARYSIAQRAEFPYMSHVSEYLIKLYPGDMFPNYPGDQYSGFGYSVYSEGPDYMPVQPAILTGGNSLCGGDPCGEEWVASPTGHTLLPGGRLWFGIDWADSTPTAPQLKYATLPGDEVKNILGVGVGDVYDWSEISQSPVFRYRFLYPFDADTSVESGWRRQMSFDSRPDSFMMRCYRTDDGQLLSFHNAGIDSLFFFGLDADADSVEIASFYGDCLDSQTLVLRNRRSMMSPLTVDIVEGDGHMLPYSFDLVLHNGGKEAIDLNVGYDRNMITGNTDMLQLSAGEVVMIQFETIADQFDSTEFMIVLGDNNNEYYPHLVRVPYPPQDVTGITGSDSVGVGGAFMFRAYPNPCRDKMMIEFDMSRGAERIEIYNVIGQIVYERGIYSGQHITWNRRDNSGQRLAAGIYFVRLTGKRGDYYIRRVILLD